MGLTDENGDVRLMGRVDDILKVCGHKINPREVASVLQRHTSVAEAVVIALVDQRKRVQLKVRVRFWRARLEGGNLAGTPQCFGLKICRRST